MTDDLVTRLLAAIDETERAARAATPGPWWTPPSGDIAEWVIYGAGSVSGDISWWFSGNHLANLERSMKAADLAAVPRHSVTSEWTEPPDQMHTDLTWA